MHLPFNYCDLLNDASGLETNKTTVQDSDRKISRDRNSDLDSIETDMVDWTSSDYLSDEVWDSLFTDSEDGTFSRTFFDDIACELELDNTYDSLFALTMPLGKMDLTNVLISNSNCMWGAQCEGQVHKPNCNRHRACRHTVIRNEMPPAAGPPGPAAQQSLLKSNLRNAGLPVFNMIGAPHTPPMSDSDGEGNMMDSIGLCGRHASTSSEVDEFDTDLKDYLVDPCRQLQQEEDEVEDEEESASEAAEAYSSDQESEYGRYQQAGPSRVHDLASLRCSIRATQNDHSYHKEKCSAMTSDLGVDTPSDSEDEIDVVTIPEKSTPPDSPRMVFIAPTNPPNDGPSCGVQRPVEFPMTSTRISNNTNIRNNNSTNNRNGVKVMLPTKRPLPTDECPPAKRRAAAPAPAVPKEPKETKERKPRQAKANNTTGRRKKKNGQDSDFCDENEPMEKRNQHNDMERQRRVDLRRLFENLREKIPEVMMKEKAAKVVILREAAKYILSLENQSDMMEEYKKELRKKQLQLKSRLAILRKEVMLNGVVFQRYSKKAKKAKV